MRVTEEKLTKWARDGNLKKLHAALQVYDYQLRCSALVHLKKLANTESSAHIIKLLDDPFISVLERSYDALKLIEPRHPVLSAFEAEIEKRSQEERKRTSRTEDSFRPIDPLDEELKLKQMAKEYDVMKIYQQGLKEEKKQLLNWKVATLIGGTIALVAYLLQYLYYAS